MLCTLAPVLVGGYTARVLLTCTSLEARTGGDIAEQSRVGIVYTCEVWGPNELVYYLNRDWSEGGARLLSKRIEEADVGERFSE